MSSAVGGAIGEAITLDFQLRNNIGGSNEEINILEFAILQALQQERDKWEEEQIKNRQGN